MAHVLGVPIRNRIQKRASATCRDVHWWRYERLAQAPIIARRDPFQSWVFSSQGELWLLWSAQSTVLPGFCSGCAHGGSTGSSFQMAVSIDSCLIIKQMSSSWEDVFACQAGLEASEFLNLQGPTAHRLAMTKLKNASPWPYQQICALTLRPTWHEGLFCICEPLKLWISSRKILNRHCKQAVRKK